MIDPLASNLVFQALQFSRNRLDVLIDPADTTLTDRSDLRYALAVLVPKFPQSTELELLTTLVGREHPPLMVGGLQRFDGASFRIEAILDGFLETQKPDFGQIKMSIVPTLTMPYCLQENVTGGIPAVNTTLTRPKTWVFKGGLANEDFAGWSDRFFDRYLADTRQFLTWQPDAKSVSQYQPEYLYFLLNCSPVPALINRRLQVNYPDGRSDVRTLDTLSGAAINQVVCVPAGMAPNGLVNDVASYQLWLSDGNNNRISQVRTFIVDNKEQAQERFILFENSLGGFDTLRILGQGSESTTVRRTLVDIDPQTAAIDAAQLRVIQVDGEQSLTVSTGYFTRQGSGWARYLEELLLSKSIYLVTPKGHVPLLLSNTELLTADDDIDLVSRVLTFKKAKVEQNFSRLPATAVQPARATGWRGVGFKQVLDGYGKRLGKVVPIRLRRYYLDDGTDVKPIVEKANNPGDTNYIAPSPSPESVAGTTPFPNVGISRAGTFNRSNCGGVLLGGPATISVAAGKYGGESAGDADQRAEAEFQSIDTQAYADQNGTCTAINEFYTTAVPTNHWHYRTNRPDVVSVYHRQDPPADMGNAQFMQDQSGEYIFRPGTNDMNFPAGNKWWYYYAVGPVGSRIRMKIYINGVLILTRTSGNMVEGGYEPGGIFTDALLGVDVTPVSGDKLFVFYELI
ncbi:hypothetical protein GCM10028819_32120 [Spirosoma humi]